VDGEGKITSVGLSLEPAPMAPASIPAFLSPAELIDRIRALLKRRPPPASSEASSGAEQPERKDA
jgi:hypothetical protein